MTTIILVIVGILAVGLAVFSWRFENCGTVDAQQTESDQREDTEQKVSEK